MKAASEGAAGAYHAPSLGVWGLLPRMVCLGAVLLAGAALRIALLGEFRFHPDEALFATLARLIVTGEDPLLGKTDLLVDKPPLFYYLLALGVSLEWGSELTARLPGLFAGVISIALTARLGWHLWRSDLAAIVAAGFVAFSPFAVGLSPTAFADPLMLAWVLGALVVVTGDPSPDVRWGVAGLLLGLASITKQSGALFVPLAVGLGMTAAVDARTSPRDIARWLVRLSAGLGVVLAAAFLWDLVRGAEVNVWSAGVAANNPHRLARSAEVWLRAAGWLRWARYVTALPPLDAALTLLVGVTLSTAVLSRRMARGALGAVLIAAWVIAYAALIWLVAFPLLDRYLLPLVPTLGLLLGWSLAAMGQGRWRLPSGRSTVASLGLLVIAVMLPQAVRASRGAYPVGGDRGAYDGIDEVAAALRDLPAGSVVYYDSLGWPLAYYLYDALIYRAPVGSPAALAADLRTFGDTGDERVLVLPCAESHAEMLAAVRSTGGDVEVLLTTANRYGECTFTVYRLVP
jgi:4-amino-4-deoxy-L-arabinose transferase-like glycosyltransferase